MKSFIRLLALPIWFATHAAAAVPSGNPFFAAEKWTRRSEAVTLSDLSIAEPRNALADKRELGHWKLLPYATADLKGVCLAALPNSCPPPVTVPLRARGWNAVYLGLGGIGRFAFGQENIVRAKLSGEEIYHARAYTGAHDDIDEVFLEAADLTGQNLQIAQDRFQALMAHPEIAGYRPAVLMYIKLIPLTDSEVTRIRLDRARTDTRRLIATMDGFSWIGGHLPTTPAELFEDFEYLRNSDVGTIYWQTIGGGLVNYPSRLGTIPGAHSDDFSRTADKYVNQSIRAFNQSGKDLTQLAIEEAHALNLKIMVSIRPAAWQTPPETEDYFSSDFYRDHPQWRCRDRDGTPVMRMSFAVPEVQNYLLGIMRETLVHRPDGIEIIYFRGLPLILWEDAFCTRFQAQYGVDPHAIPETDPRLYDLRGEILTEFMRKIRGLLDETQRAQGRRDRLTLSASVVHTEMDNRIYGLDVARWVKEGLVDRIGIFPAAFHTSHRPMELDWFRRITAGTTVGFYPVLLGWKLPSAEAALTLSRTYYDAGAAGMEVWDADETGTFNPLPNQMTTTGGSYNVAHQASYWPLVSRLGHVQELRQMSQSDLPQPRYIPLKRYGDYWFGRWIPDVGF